MKRIRPIAAVLALFFSATAHASLVMQWAFTGTAPGSSAGHGTFTVRGWDNTLDGNFTEYLDYLTLSDAGTYVPNQDEFYVMTGATGWINDKAISLMPKYSSTYNEVTAETTETGFAGNDNVVLDPSRNAEGNLVSLNAASRGFFTPFGVSLIDSSNTMWNLSVPYVSGSVTYQLINSGDTFVDGDEFLNYTVTDGAFTLEVPGAAVVPIPAAAWLFLSGVGGLFMAGRRRSAQASAG